MSLMDTIERYKMWGEYGAAVGRGDRTLTASQTSTLLTVVTFGITIAIGILIYGEVNSALPQPENTELQNASTNSTNTFADTMEFAPVVMIVLIAALVVGVVQRFG